MAVAKLEHPARISVEDYLARERESETRHEYYSGEIVAMAGATTTHNLIVMTLGGLFFNAFRKRSCIVLGSDQRVRVSKTTYVYPDISLVCGEMKLDPGSNDVLLNPTVIIEVLSPSTELRDRGEKAMRYRRMESLQEYLLVSQSAPHIELYRRTGAVWTLIEADTLEGEITLDSVGCTLRLADVYERVAFEDTTIDEGE